MDPLNIRPVHIEEEIQSSYLDYSMSVIIGRALPDVRDGLKPVHRRVLYSMHELNLEFGRPYKKSARVVGDCIGKYHPHGDAAVYDTIVRMAQDFSLRYPLVDGQGNFGSIDNDPPAAMRYTEVRMARITSELLADLEKETADFQPNYDNSMEEPTVLPTRVPNLLVNGSSGIAVGMSTNVPPHNLREVIDATVALINDRAVSDEALFKFIPGPDFPTGALIVSREGIREAYRTGRGIITVRGKAHIEKSEKGEKESLIITEIPFQLNKARMLESISELVKDKRIDGITDIRDESNREGIRVVVELRRDARSQVVLRNLYKYTPLQSSFGIIMLAIVNGQPEVLSLRQLLEHFIAHRKEVVIRRTRFELRKAEERAHILQGFKIALDNLDEVIRIIRESVSPVVAKERLMIAFGLSERQSQAILDLRLQRLTGMERDKILEEYRQVMALIEDLKDILAKEARVFEIIVNELLEVREKYGDNRRTQIIDADPTMTDEDLIPDQEMVVTVSHQGYIKRNPLNQYRAQNRGGRGKMGMATKEEDYVEDLFIATNHDYLMIFTSQGRVYRLKVYDLPLASRTAKGKPIVNLIDLGQEEKVAAVLPVRSFDGDRTIVMVTTRGVIKQTELSAFANVRSAGLKACTVDEGDELQYVRVAKPAQDILLVTRLGKAIRFPGTAVRTMGRDARGVRGMDLREGDVIVGVDVLELEPGVRDDLAAEAPVLELSEEVLPVSPEEEEARKPEEREDVNAAYILTVTANGFGKRTRTGDYRRQGRGGLGIINIQVGDRNGDVVGSLLVHSNDEIMLITNTGVILRTKASQVRITGRSAMGVKMMNLEKDERIVSIARVLESLVESSAGVVVEEVARGVEDEPVEPETLEAMNGEGVEG